jgi:hypothetical protein
MEHNTSLQFNDAWKCLLSITDLSVIITSSHLLSNNSVVRSRGKGIICLFHCVGANNPMLTVQRPELTRSGLDCYSLQLRSTKLAHLAMVLQTAMSQIDTLIFNLTNLGHYHFGDLLVTLTKYIIHGRVQYSKANSL